MAAFKECSGMNVLVKPFFEIDDTINRIEIHFIGRKNKVSFVGTTQEAKDLVDFLAKEIKKANKIKYIK